MAAQDGGLSGTDAGADPDAADVFWLSLCTDASDQGFYAINIQEPELCAMGLLIVDLVWGIW